eukprot:1720575-Amphidinium_carterae.1
MHQASLGRFLGPRGSAAARQEREVEDIALRLGLAWPEKGWKVGAPSRQELFDSALWPFTAPFAMKSGRS